MIWESIIYLGGVLSGLVLSYLVRNRRPRLNHHAEAPLPGSLWEIEGRVVVVLQADRFSDFFNLNLKSQRVLQVRFRFLGPAVTPAAEVAQTFRWPEWKRRATPHLGPAGEATVKLLTAAADE